MLESLKYYTLNEIPDYSKYLLTQFNQGVEYFTNRDKFMNLF